MVEIVDNLVLEHLKRFQATLERVERKLDDLTIRVSHLETGLASVMQHIANQAATSAAQLVAIDTINGRLDRIERRLELTN